MVIAIVIAGGSGNRMGNAIPKQFIKIYDKPVLAYTLDAFQKHDNINAIEVVCIEGWEKEVEDIATKYGINKLKWITKGGDSAQESIRNGVFNLEGKCSSDDIIIIHDGIRPIVDYYVIEDVIDKCMRFGNGVTSMPYNEQIFITDDEETSTKYIPRKKN